jgi:hypothetical protein
MSTCGTCGAEIECRECVDAYQEKHMAGITLDRLERNKIGMDLSNREVFIVCMRLGLDSKRSRSWAYIAKKVGRSETATALCYDGALDKVMTWYKTKEDNDE